ncbi:MFS transporter [Micromonospora sp. M12]
MPSTLALISNVFHDAKQRGVAIAVWFSCLMVGGALGPVVGGALLEYFWWGSVFLMGVPVMVLLLIFGPVLLPEYRDPRRAGSTCSACCSPADDPADHLWRQGGGRRGLDHQLGRGHPGRHRVRRDLRGAAAAAGAPARGHPALPDPRVQCRAGDPALRLGDHRWHLPVGQPLPADRRGLSPLRAGLWLLPSTLAIIVGSMMAPALVQKVRPAYLIAAGLAVTSFGYLLLTQVSSTSGLALLVTGFVLAFLGAGPMGALGTDLVVGSAPPQKAGSAARCRRPVTTSASRSASR